MGRKRYYLLWVFLIIVQQAKAQAVTAVPDSTKNDTVKVREHEPAMGVRFHPFTFRQAYVPAALIATGIVATTLFTDQLKYKIVEERNRHFAGFHTNIDDYMQYAPIPIAYGLDALGVKSENDVLNRSLILLKGEALMLISVNTLKYTTHELRPDGGNHYSFPSGHTAQAFAAATFLSEEYKHRFSWMPYAAYGVAGATGLLRIANNRHFIGDVLMGAGLGILSMKVAYWTHQYKWGRRKKRYSFPSG